MMKGCKHTEVGVIPHDWDVVELGSLITSVEYGSSAKSSATGLVPVLRMGNLQGGRIDWADLVYTSDEREISRYSLKNGDVLFNRTNTIGLVGKTSIYESDRPAIFAGYLIRVNVEGELLDSHFLNYVLNANFSKRYSQKVLSVAVGQANINGKKLRTYPIPLPPKMDEQRAIATALSEIDALLTGLDKLIAKKHDIKQATMQQLLTGKTRLPGFTCPWEVRRLGEMASIRNNKILPQDVKPDTLCVELEHVEQGTGKILVHGRAEGSSAAKYRFMAGDVLFGRLRSYLRKYWLAGSDGICSTEIWPIVANEDFLIPEFLFYSVQMDSFINAASVSYGTHMPRADWSVILNYEMGLPSVSEQVEIAAVLSDMDKELQGLRARRENTHLLKQGMMQELLTGRTRLV